MKRSLVRMALISAFVSVGIVSLASTASAQVHVNINIGPPPPVVVAAPPTMLFLPEPGLYVAVGIPYDIYFVSGRYYYLRGNDWFWAPGYGGPWVYVVNSSLPPGLRKYKVKSLHDFRDREYRVYQVQGHNFKGQKFVAVRGQDGNSQGENHGNGKGNGNGRGNGKKK